MENKNILVIVVVAIVILILIMIYNGRRVSRASGTVNTAPSIIAAIKEAASKGWTAQQLLDTLQSE